jgi:hypothetical protein
MAQSGPGEYMKSSLWEWILKPFPSGKSLHRWLIHCLGLLLDPMEFFPALILSMEDLVLWSKAMTWVCLLLLLPRGHSFSPCFLHGIIVGSEASSMGTGLVSGAIWFCLVLDFTVVGPTLNFKTKPCPYFPNLPLIRWQLSLCCAAHG